MEQHCTAVIVLYCALAGLHFNWFKRIFMRHCNLTFNLKNVFSNSIAIGKTFIFLHFYVFQNVSRKHFKMVLEQVFWDSRWSIRMLSFEYHCTKY